MSDNVEKEHDTETPVLEDVKEDIKEEPVVDGPPKIWDKARQADDQEKANARKSSQPSTKEIVAQVLEAQLEHEALKQARAEATQRSQEFSSLANIDPNTLEDTDKLGKVLQSITMQIDSLKNASSPAVQQDAEIKAQIARLIEKDQAQEAVQLKAAQQDAFNQYWVAKREMVGDTILKEAWSTAQKIRKDSGYDFASVGAETAILAVETQLNKILVDQAKGLRPKPDVNPDSGSGGKTPATGKEGTFEEVLADMRSKGKVG